MRAIHAEVSHKSHAWAKAIRVETKPPSVSSKASSAIGGQRPDGAPTASCARVAVEYPRVSPIAHSVMYKTTTTASPQKVMRPATAWEIAHPASARNGQLATGTAMPSSFLLRTARATPNHAPRSTVKNANASACQLTHGGKCTGASQLSVKSKPSAYGHRSPKEKRPEWGVFSAGARKLKIRYRGKSPAGILKERWSQDYYHPPQQCCRKPRQKEASAGWRWCQFVRCQWPRESRSQTYRQ